VRSAALIVITTLSGCLSLGDTESDPSDASAGGANAYDSGIWPDAALDAPTGGVAGTAGGGTGGGGGVAGAGLGGGGAGGSGGCPACGCGVNFQTDNSNCGACGVSCQRPHAIQSCNAGNCTGFMCIGLWLDCNDDEADGCETSGNVYDHCGSCLAKCNETNASSANCSNGNCSHACKTGYADCNGPLPGSTDDGCETNVHTNSAHCGACGAVCGAGYACVLGVCKAPP
jgi:hypothetical protein